MTVAAARAFLPGSSGPTPETSGSVACPKVREPHSENPTRDCRKGTWFPHLVDAHFRSPGTEIT